MLAKGFAESREKMGIWEWMGSTAEAVKRNAPDVKPLLNATKTYGFNRIYQMMPGDQTKSIIYCYTTKFAKNAAIYALHEGYKLIPGGVTVSKVVSNTIKDVKNENLKLERTIAPPAEAAAKSAEDVIDAFMMKEFFGNRFFDHLMVSPIAKKEGKSSCTTHQPS